MCLLSCSVPEPPNVGVLQKFIAVEGKIDEPYALITNLEMLPKDHNFKSIPREEWRNAGFSSEGVAKGVYCLSGR